MTAKELRDLRLALGMSRGRMAQYLWPTSWQDTAKRRLRRMESGRLEINNEVRAKLCDLALDRNPLRVPR